MHDISLVVTLTAALAVALVLGWTTQRLGLSTIVGYLLAGIVVVAKPLAAWIIVRTLRDTPRTAATVAVGLAQIGEFSFLLGALGISLGVLPQAGLDTLVAAAIASIAMNPLLFRWLARWESRQAPAPAARAADRVAGEVEGHVVVCGSGPLHRAIATRLRASEAAVTVIDDDLDFVNAQATASHSAVYGQPLRQGVLRAAGVERAGVVVIAAPSLAAQMAICVAARAVRPDVRIVATAADPGARAWLEEFGASGIVDVTSPAVEAIARTVRQVRDAPG